MQPHLNSYRFSRIERLIGAAKLARLQDRLVTIVGLGAVGGYALEGLARSGIRHFRLIDFDVISLENINRQILALESTLGQAKTEAASCRVKEINPGCEVEKLNLFVDQHSLQQVLTPRPDLLIDAIDTIGPKIELLAAARQQGVPVISSMGAALRTDPALIRTADLFETSNCPLARRMRKKLRSRGIGQGIICVYSLEVAHSDFHKQRPASRDEEPGGKRILGSLPTITAIFGLTMANLALARLADG